jgi:putative endonuclease
MKARLLGKWGEAVAAEFLRKKGYEIVGVNYKSRFGELDLIAKKGKIVAFIEVKLRKNPDFAYARENVGASKQKRIKTTAEIWISENRCGLQPRFDVIEIYAPEGYNGKADIEHIENAF